MLAALGKPHLHKQSGERRTRLEAQALLKPLDYVCGMVARLRLWRGVGKQQGWRSNRLEQVNPHRLGCCSHRSVLFLERQSQTLASR